jgi:flagellar basal-body rod modification protein FlgD
MIQGTTSTTSTSTTSTSSTVASNTAMGKDSFLKLLLTQLKNQDPLKPMESYEFTAQLAQFTQIESLADIKTLLTTQGENNQSLISTLGSTLSVGLIGKEVSINTTSLAFDGKTAVKFGFDVPEEAKTLGISIYDSSGNLVRDLDMSSFTQGTNSVTWDGKDAEGNLVEKGDYVLSVAYKNEAGDTYNVETYITGKISGLKYKNGETYLVVDGNEINFKNLKEILGGTNAGG